VVVGRDIRSHMSLGKVIDYLAWQVWGFSTFARRKEKQDIEVVVGMQMAHWTARRRRADPHKVGGELMGLKKILLADCSTQIEASKHDA
jgi:hypothetical protein